jgi:hypothetical protein
MDTDTRAFTTQEHLTARVYVHEGTDTHKKFSVILLDFVVGFGTEDPI